MIATGTPGKIDVASPGIAERVRTLAVMCMRKASSNIVISTVAASWVAISDPLVATPRRMTPAACPPTVAALIRKSGEASGDLRNQEVHRRHPGRGWNSPGGDGVDDLLYLVSQKKRGGLSTKWLEPWSWIHVAFREW